MFSRSLLHRKLISCNRIVDSFTFFRNMSSLSRDAPTSATAVNNVIPFEMDKSFVSKYTSIKPSFGFNGLGELVYLRSYSREMPNGQREQWHNTVERVVTGTFRMQQEWAAKSQLPFDAVEAQSSAQSMFDKMFQMKFLPPGRGLWAMGSELTEQKKLYGALNNCAFVSTEVPKRRKGVLDNSNSATSGGGVDDVCKPYSFLMDASMLGVGVGFDTKGANTTYIREVLSVDSGPDMKMETDAGADASAVYVIPDSREGWVESVRLLLSAFLVPAPDGTAVDVPPVRAPQFDYSQIRPAGAKIRGFGGTSQGPGILQELHVSLSELLGAQKNSLLNSTTIVDVMNLIGRCVVAGNVRRTAEIAFGSPTDSAYTALKDYTVNPHRASYGWTSNNSVYAELGMDYRKLCSQHVTHNGEPGFAWLENMQSFSRMDGSRDYIDAKARGGNPCLEQTLESFEVCCLVETFPFRHSTLDEYKDTLRVAMLYAKTVTLGATHWPETNAVMLRNRRIGCSMSGIAQFLAARGHHTLKEWCTEGYKTVRAADTEFSAKFCVPNSIKVTSVKPSGTVSLLAGATPGIHFPESRFYLRRVRLPADSALLSALRVMGYRIEPDVTAPDKTMVVEFPVDLFDSPGVDAGARGDIAMGQSSQEQQGHVPTAVSSSGSGVVKTLDEVTCWEQLALAAFLQRYWADNQVSCTVTFDPLLEGHQLASALDYYQYQLKGISFLPRINYTMRDRFFSAMTADQSSVGSSTSSAKGVSSYAQMPYESISEDIYTRYIQELQEHQAQYQQRQENSAVIVSKSSTTTESVKDTGIAGIAGMSLSALYCLTTAAAAHQQNININHDLSSFSSSSSNSNSNSNSNSTPVVEELISVPDLFCDSDSCSREM